MGNLAFSGSHAVNGVAALHSELMQQTVFADLHRLYPERISNKTNGVTPEALAVPVQSGPHGGWSATPSVTGSSTDFAQLERLDAFATDRRVPAPLLRGQAGQQGAAGRPLSCAAPGRHGQSTRSLFDVAHQADSRVQAPAPEPAPRRRPVPPHPRPARWLTGRRASSCSAARRRPSYYNAKLIVRLANDIGSDDQLRPRRGRPAQGRVRPRTTT